MVDRNDSISCSSKELVKGELEIIKSAFPNEFQDETIIPGTTTVRLKLGPLHNQGVTLDGHVFVTVKISTCVGYPYKSAEVILESYEGITSQESEVLLNELNELSFRFSQSGLVVMLDICNHVQNYLSDHGKPYSESIYAEMVAGWRAKEAAALELEEQNIQRNKKLEEEQQLHLQEEVARVQDALKEEARLRKIRTKYVQGRELNRDQGTLNEYGLSDRTVSECSNETQSNDPLSSSLFSYSVSGKEEHFLVLHEGLGERPEQNCFLELGVDRMTLQRSVLYAWSVNAKHLGRRNRPLKAEVYYQMEDLLTKLNNIEKEISSILKLSHDNLVAYRGMKVVRPHDNCVQIYLVEEYVQGLSLQYYLENELPVNEPLLYHLASGLINALDYLHKNNIVHRNIRDSCLFLDHCSRKVKLADYGIETRCVEAVMEFLGEQPPSVYPPSPGKGGKKCDVFRAGIVLLSLFLGKRIKEVAPVLPSDLNPDLCSFLSHCLEISEQERWTTDQLLTHPYFISGIERRRGSSEEQKCLKMDREKFELTATFLEAGEGDLATSLSVPQNLKGYSRFIFEYNLLEWLGKGGFGDVYKVRNKVDDRVYALKRIPLHQQSENARRKMTREVKLLSSLNHENVVRYYTSWIEFLAVDQLQDKEKAFYGIDNHKSGNCLDGSSLHSESKVLESDMEEDDRDWLMQSLRDMYEEGDESDSIVFMNSAEEVEESEEISPAKNSVAHPVKKLQFLYIQMQYCEKNTLRQAIDRGLYVDQERVWRLFIEITNGLDYIHSQGLIHRDLKPGNIFLDSSDHVKIGDFGLATVAFKDMNVVHEVSNLEIETLDVKETSALSGQVGTTFYIAPEISKDASRGSYSNKVDVYSLGIIFFEMIYPLSTGMERVKILSSIRLPQPQIPEDFESKETKNKQKLILWLLSHDPQQRPSTNSLLKSSLVPPPTEEKQKFMSTLESKVENKRSQDYQDILSLFFKSMRPELEATFEVDMHQYGLKQLLVSDWVRMQVASIFRSHGGIWVPTPFYIPKGSFYQNKESLVTLMSRGGELIASQFELRYPFARFVARNDCRHLRRYGIDRVQRAHKISGIHPTEIYECAFDVIAAKQDVYESCGRVLLVAQDILQKISCLQSSQVILKISHSELPTLILSHCGIEDHLRLRVINLLKDFRGNSYHLEYFGESLRAMGVNRNALEALKGFMLIEGPLSDVCSILQLKMVSSSKKKVAPSSLIGIISQLKNLLETLPITGVRFDIVIQPLMIVDQILFEGITFRLIPQLPSSKNASYNIFAQGGVYDHLIARQNKRLDGLVSAVGISLPLERIIATVDTNKLFTSVGMRGRLHGQVNSEMPFLDLFICAIEERQLKERISLTLALGAENVIVDHGFASNMMEADNLFEEFWHVSHFLFLGPSDKAIIRSCEDRQNHASVRANDRKIPLCDLYDYLLKTIKFTRTSESQPLGAVSIKRELSKSSKDSFKPEDLNINIEYITQKQAKSKDAAKIDSKIVDDVKSSLASHRPAIAVADCIDVFALDLERKALLALGQLDVDSNVRNFNDSVTDVKSRFPEIKNYIERICTVLSKKIFYGKKSDRPSMIICYSIPSETLKRLL